MRKRVLAAAWETALLAIALTASTPVVAQQKSTIGTAAHQASSVTAIPETEPALDYTTSWLGNTLPGYGAGTEHALQHVPLNMNGIFATPDGTVYTNTPWEEGGRPVSIFKDGQLISPLNDENNSPNYSNGGGVAVVADAEHVFRSDCPNGTGVTILKTGNLFNTNLSLSGSNTLGNSHGVLGMAIAGGKLYVTENDFNKVEVFSLKDLTLLNSFAIDNPVRIAVDSAGGIWVSHRDQTPLPALNGNVYNINGQMGLPTVDHYDSTGTWVNSISLPTGGEVGALWINRLNYLLVGDDGPEQNIKVYADLDTQPKLLRTFGVKGGIYAGDVNERGQIGPWRFRSITGLATDAQDNLYVSESGYGLDGGVGHGAVLQSYDAQQNLKWTVDALEFVTTADADPASQWDIYDPYHHFKVAYERPTGWEARYAADTYNRFLYPDDVRVTSIASTAQVQNIQGRKFLLVGSQGGGFMAIYRFDDSPTGPGKEIAIPSVAFDYGSFQQSYKDFDVEPLDGEFIWRDLNGDGRITLNEFTEPPNNSHRDGNSFWMDSKGDVWQVNYNSNYESPIHLRRYLFQGFDKFGSPIYDFTHVKTYDVATDFTDTTTVQRAIFRPEESQGGTLYIAAGSPNTGAFSQIIRYDNWDKGNRKAKWIIDVPWDPDPNNSWIPNSFTEVGNFLFVDFNVPHYVLIYSTKTGQYVGRFTPSEKVGGLPNIGNDDEWNSMHAFKLCDGEYVLLKEEDYQAKQLMYRWHPPSTLTPPPVPEPPTNLQVTPEDEGITISWTGSTGALIYNVFRSTVPGGPYTLADSGVTGTSVTDQGLINGKKYYYVVSALTETGTSAKSTEVTAVPVPAGTTYEAESGVLAGGAGIYAGPLDSGGARVGALGPGASTTLSNIVVPTTGTYAVRLYYGNGDGNTSDVATIDLIVNNGPQFTSPNLPYTGDYAIPGYVTIDIQLNQGTNTIVLGNPASDPNGAPDIDRLVVPYKPL